VFDNIASRYLAPARGRGTLVDLLRRFSRSRTPPAQRRAGGR